MTTLQHRLYARIVQLHPANFSDRFGREMMLDFADASATSGFAPLCLDALLSLGRQWTASALHDTTEQVQTRKLSLLAGDYVMISPGGPSPFNLARASVLATLLLFAICSALSTATRHIIDLPVGSGSQARGIRSSAHHSAYAADGTDPTSTKHRTAIEVLGQPTGRLDPHSEAEASSQNTGSIGASVIDPELKKYLWQLAAFIEFVWLMALLLYKRPSIGRKVALAVFCLLAFAAPLTFAAVRPTPIHAQLLHATAPLPSFEVATIKPFTQALVPLPPPPPPAPNANRRPAKVAPGNGGGVTTDIFHTILPAQLLIAFAYNVPFGFETRRIFGAPAWLNTDAYELQGKIGDSLFAAMQKMTPAQQREQVNLMEQSLLADRFKLKVHFETREMAGFELVIAKGGPKLAPAKDNGNARISLSNVPHGNHLTAISTTIDQWIHSPFLNGRTIIDHTGLDGLYDFTLTWAPEQLDASTTAPENTSDAPSLFTAIQEQLGLRLVPAKVPVEVIVIDHVEKPSEN